MGGYKVEVYIYDLTQGMARTMGPALIGRPLDGIWHTAIVVFSKEYFFGGGGIEFCRPGGTVMGQPLKIEDLGETQITEQIFQDYLSNQSRDRFRGDRYDLLNHNCNNFSHETAQFLTGKGIPQHILDLPREILSTPMGQMLAPMIQQMSPSGSSLPSGVGQQGTRLETPSGSSLNSGVGQQGTKDIKPQVSSLPIKELITFDQAVKIEGLTKKLEEFNNSQSNLENKLSDSELKVVAGIAKGLVRLSDDNFNILTKKMLNWERSQMFPLLDILRDKVTKPASFDNPGQVDKVLDMFLTFLTDSNQVTAMLSARGLCNIIANYSKLQCSKITQFVTLEAIMNGVIEQLPTSHPNLETSLSSLLLNISVLQLSSDSQNIEVGVMLATNLAISVIPSLGKDEAIYRSLVAVGNLVSSQQTEVTDLLRSLELVGIIETQELTSSNKDQKISQMAKEVIRLLGSSRSKVTNGGIDLD